MNKLKKQNKNRGIYMDTNENKIEANKKNSTLTM